MNLCMWMQITWRSKALDAPELSYKLLWAATCGFWKLNLKCVLLTMSHLSSPVRQTFQRSSAWFWWDVVYFSSIMVISAFIFPISFFVSSSLLLVSLNILRWFPIIYLHPSVCMYIICIYIYMYKHHVSMHTYSIYMCIWIYTFISKQGLRKSQWNFNILHFCYQLIKMFSNLHCRSCINPEVIKATGWIPFKWNFLVSFYYWCLL